MRPAPDAGQRGEEEMFGRCAHGGNWWISRAMRFATCHPPAARAPSLPPQSASPDWFGGVAGRQTRQIDGQSSFDKVRHQLIGLGSRVFHSSVQAWWLGHATGLGGVRRAPTVAKRPAPSVSRVFTPQNRMRMAQSPRRVWTDAMTFRDDGSICNDFCKGQ